MNTPHPPNPVSRPWTHHLLVACLALAFAPLTRAHGTSAASGHGSAHAGAHGANPAAATSDIQSLAHQLAKAESMLDPKTLARFASFDGLVRMDEQGNHPPGQGANAHDGHGTGHSGHTESSGGSHAQHAH